MRLYSSNYHIVQVIFKLDGNRVVDGSCCQHSATHGGKPGSASHELCPGSFPNIPCLFQAPRLAGYCRKSSR